MSSKTFKHGDEVIQILGIPENRTVSIFVLDSDNDEAQMTIAQSDAPALALAILEAAGLPDADDDWLGEAVNGLRKHIQIRDERTAEAKEQAELEAEARDFYDVYHSAADWPYQDWVMLEERYKAQFIAVARRAREMRRS